MANGKKNYFRHSFFARNDIKLLQLRDSIGVGYYFYFFTLLEICGEESADNLQDEYEFHDSTIRSLWRINLKKSERIANEMHTVGLLEFEKREKSFWFKIPNFMKYLGKYTNKKESKGPNKSKEKERKEKKSKTNIQNDFNSIPKSKKLEITPANIQQLYNQLIAPKLGTVCHGFSPSQRDSLVEIIQTTLKSKKEWEDFFNSVQLSNKLMGQDPDYKHKFVPSWMCDQDKIIKILNGEYSNNGPSNNLPADLQKAYLEGPPEGMM